LRPRVLSIDNLEDVKEAFRALNVSSEGIDIMSPKAIYRLVKVTGIDSRAANIIKQEMLARGGEAAAPWELYKLDSRKIDMILMGTLRQFDVLCQKLALQPFGLPQLAEDIKKSLNNYTKSPPTIEAGRFKLDLSLKTHIMGILNITPDSFSDGGRFFDYSIAVEQARQMVLDGADIIDVGGESTRPGAEPVTLEEETNRVVPIIKALSSELNIPISIDTYKPEVARRALDAGASIINDISGLRDENMVELVAERGVPVIIMHMRGTPQDMQLNPTYEDVVAEVIDWLDKQAGKAVVAGVSKDKILVDPGIGFGKNMGHNLELMKRLSEFKSLEYPVVLGTSRKTFIGAVLDLPVEERIEGTLATVVYGITQGANIVRVHDVKEAARASKMTDVLIARENK